MESKNEQRLYVSRVATYISRKWVIEISRIFMHIKEMYSLWFFGSHL